MPSNWDQLKIDLATLWQPSRWRHVGVVVGCSGGADSVALLQALHQLRQSGETPPRGFLVAAHLNHSLRDKDSDDDAEFVRDLAQKLSLRFETEKLSGTEDSEAALRTARLRFLTDVACRHGARYVALGHSADDNAETVLHQLIRGTGPAGLSGIPPTRPLDADLVLVHPLLNARREAIRQALREIEQPWREDSSNDSLAYARNWIRHRVLPMLAERYPHVVPAIDRAAKSQRRWQEVMAEAAEAWLTTHGVNSERGDNCAPECNCAAVRLRRPTDAPQAVVVLALQQLWDRLGWPRGEMSQTHWQRLDATLRDTEPASYQLPAAIHVIARDEVTLQR